MAFDPIFRWLQESIIPRNVGNLEFLQLRNALTLMTSPLLHPHFFRSLQETINPKNPDNLDFLQPAQCAYADDLAIASSPFRDLMVALAPAFRSIDYIAGLNLNYRECGWVQYDNDEHDWLRTWISENCTEFREMQIVRLAKHVGTMIDWP